MEDWGNPYVPLGWRSTVPSIKEGQYLHYFNPSPLSEWVRHFPASEEVDFVLSSEAIESLFACLVQGAIAQQRYASFPLEHRVNDCAAKQLVSASAPIRKESLLEIARGVTGKRTPGFRNQIVYAGKAAAEGSLLYAQEDLIEELISDLLMVLENVNRAASQRHFLSALLLNILLIHPFLDGNGRVARTIVLRVAKHQGCLATGTMVAGLQWWNREWFMQIGSASREAGLVHYLFEFDEKMSIAVKQVQASGIVQIVERAANSPAFARGDTRTLAVLRHFLAAGALDQNQIKAALSCSSRKAAGMLDEISTLSEAFAFSGDCLSCAELHESTARAMRIH